MRVFVYGTLREGEYNHSYISNNLVKSLGVYKTREKFYMIYKNGLSFPYLVAASLLQLNTPPIQITGEVYEITEEGLNQINLLEGVPRHYQRDVIFVENGSSFAMCFIYVLNDVNYIKKIQESMEEGFSIITSGDWLQKDHSKH